MMTKVQAAGHRGFGRAALLAATLLVAALPVRAEDAPASLQDRWHLSIQTPYGFNSGGSQGSYYFQTTPGTAFSASETPWTVDRSRVVPLRTVMDIGTFCNRSSRFWAVTMISSIKVASASEAAEAGFWVFGAELAGND